MITKKITLQDLRLDTRYEDLKKVSGTEFSKIKKFINESKNGELNGGIDITENTERKYIDALSMAYKHIKKEQLNQLTKADLTNLKQDLKSGKIKSRNKKPYALTSQREMELILIRFLEFVNPKKYGGFKKWFVVKVPKKSVEYLKEEEIIKLYNACKTNQERFLICVIFDGGLRASEFLNTRFEDWQEPTQSFPYYKVLIKEEYSKTSERNIGLYWKHSTEAIRDYFAELDDSNLKAPVFPKNYDAIRIFLTRLGKRILNKRIHFHIFRKSSASYYATKLKSRQQLCYRYGWGFSSSMPDVYISRQQGEEEVKDEMKQLVFEKLEKENQELKTKVIINEEKNQKEIENQKGEIEKVNKKLNAFLEIMEDLTSQKFNNKELPAILYSIKEGTKEIFDIPKIKSNKY